MLIKRKRDSPVIKLLKKWCVTRMQCLINIQVIQNVGRYRVALFYDKCQIKETLAREKQRCWWTIPFSQVELRPTPSIRYLSNCYLSPRKLLCGLHRVTVTAFSPNHRPKAKGLAFTACGPGFVETICRKIWAFSFSVALTTHQTTTFFLLGKRRLKAEMDSCSLVLIPFHLTLQSKSLRAETSSRQFNSLILVLPTWISLKHSSVSSEPWRWTHRMHITRFHISLAFIL